MTQAPGWIIYGSRPRYAHDLAEIIRRRGEHLVAAVDNLADDPEPDASLPMSGRASLSELDRGLRVALAAGPPSIRRQLVDAALADGFARFDPLVDPTAVVASTVPVAEGVTVNVLAVIASHSRLERFVQVNRGASIGHDVVLNEFVTIGPGAVLTGFVDVGAGAFIGASATVLPRVSMGAGSTVGAGAVVTRDVPPNAVVVGNPARVIGENPVDEVWAGHTSS